MYGLCPKVLRVVKSRFSLSAAAILLDIPYKVFPLLLQLLMFLLNIMSVDSRSLLFLLYLLNGCCVGQPLYSYESNDNDNESTDIFCRGNKGGLDMW